MMCYYSATSKSDEVCDTFQKSVNCAFSFLSLLNDSELQETDLRNEGNIPSKL
jgi:hypothetical protein